MEFLQGLNEIIYAINLVITSSYIIIININFSILLGFLSSMISPVPCPHLSAKLTFLAYRKTPGKIGSPSNGWFERVLMEGDSSEKSSHFTIMSLSKAVKQWLMVFIIPILQGAHPQCLQ